jgi:hypothetical protein
MTKDFRIEGVRADGSAQVLFSTQNNYQRLNKIALSGTWSAIRLIPNATWGAENIHIFSFEVF